SSATTRTTAANTKSASATASSARTTATRTCTTSAPTKRCRPWPTWGWARRPAGSVTWRRASRPNTTATCSSASGGGRWCATVPLREALLGRKLGVRGRMHGVWALAHANGSVRELLDVARTDPEPRVQVQALRAVADLNDPALGGSRAEAASLAAELAEFAR